MNPSAFLFDLDGTLYTEDGSIPGAVDAIARLRRRGFRLRFVTNTTRHSRRHILDRLRGYGFEVVAEELFTPTAAAAVIFAEHGEELVAPFMPVAAMADLEGACSAVPVSSRPLTMRSLSQSWSATICGMT